MSEPSSEIAQAAQAAQVVQEAQPRKRTSYFSVFVLLGILTLIEVWITYLPIPRIQVLVPIAVVKAALVVLYYMHLRYDKRIYTALFLMGLLMGALLLFALIALFAPQPLDVP